MGVAGHLKGEATVGVIISRCNERPKQLLALVRERTSKNTTGRMSLAGGNRTSGDDTVRGVRGGIQQQQ